MPGKRGEKHRLSDFNAVYYCIIARTVCQPSFFKNKKNFAYPGKRREKTVFAFLYNKEEKRPKGGFRPLRERYEPDGFVAGAFCTFTFFLFSDKIVSEKTAGRRGP